MFKSLLASLRLAVAMVSVGLSLILGGQWLGVVPDMRDLQVQGRIKQCEAVAINAASQIRRGKWSELKSIMDVIVERDDDLVSMGIRGSRGELRYDSGDHSGTWELASERDIPGARVHVPLVISGIHWGDIEFCYQEATETFWESIFSHPTARLLGYFAGAGMLSYLFFAARLMGVFGRTQVVPERVSQALDTLAEGLLVLDERGRIVLANQAFAKNVGLECQELIGKRTSSLDWITEEGKEDVEFPWDRAIHSREAQTESLLRLKSSDGKVRIYSSNSSPIMAEDGKHRGTLATFRDVTHVEEHRAELERMLNVLETSRNEIEQKNTELEILATQDSLTGCLNRRAFFEKFEVLWNEAQDQNSPLACVMFDNDHFKRINDTYGHHTGDEVLRAVSSLLRGMFGDVGLVCRYGGEEFCVVLPGCDAKHAAELAEKARLEFEKVRLEDPPELRISASVGVSDLSFQATDPQTLINQADVCLYVAKRQGRNRVITFEPTFGDMPEEAASDSREETPASAARKQESIPFQAVTALLSALSYRDADTADHSRRVADLCVTAAKGLLDKRQAYILETAALLHDIGKIGVPDHILLKPGKLTPDEWKIMGQHDRIGVEILAETFHNEELSEIIRTHHAFFGGKARDPHLPVGADIPIGSRILTVCDTYDAIVSDRPYRKGQSHEAAIEELRRCAGTQFDPEVVEHFATAIEANRPGSADEAARSAELQMGMQLESVVKALQEQDRASLNALANRLAHYAACQDDQDVAEKARVLAEVADTEEQKWVEVLRATTNLIAVCRESASARGESVLGGSGAEAQQATTTSNE